MSFHRGLIERSNRKNLEHVEVQITVMESDTGCQSWFGHFASRSVDAILPDERLVLTLDGGLRGTARVNETCLDSRTPETTTVHFVGTGSLV